MNEVLKKYWIFYLINTENVMGTCTYDIYAFTDEEELAINFSKTRNMKKFYEKKIKLNRKEWNELLKENLNAELSYIEGYYVSKKYKPKDIKVAVTKREKMFCNNDETILIHEKLLGFAWEDVNVFKDKYYDALYTLCMPQLHEFVVTGGDMEMCTTAQSRLKPNTFNMLLSHVRGLFIENTEEDGDFLL